MISSKILEKVFNLIIEKQPKRKILYCSVCKCKTLKIEEVIHKTSIWNCTRPEHDEKLNAHFEQLAIEALNNEYYVELKKIENEEWNKHEKL